MNRKTEWNVAFEKYLRELDAKKPVVWGGTFVDVPRADRRLLMASYVS
jgi:AP endonuclease-1